MKKILFVFLLSITSISFAHNCHDHGSDNQPMKSVSGEGFEIDNQKYTKFTKGLASGEQVAVVNVNGMVCDFCARGIEKTFMKSADVKKVDVDLEVGKVLIAYSSDTKISFEDIKEKITANGQTAVDMKVLKL
jgi:copper chaperone CopZ